MKIYKVYLPYDHLYKIACCHGYRRKKKRWMQYSGILGGRGGGLGGKGQIKWSKLLIRLGHVR